MAGPAQQGGGQSGDHTTGILWIIAAIFVAVGIIWITLKKYIVIFFLTLKLKELAFITFFTQHLHLNTEKFTAIQTGIEAALLNPLGTSFNDIVSLGTEVGNWLRFPIMAALLLLAIVVYRGNTARMFRKTYSMRDLLNLEKHNWPQIAPIANAPMDLIKTDIDKGPWAMAMTPMQFCKKNNLIDVLGTRRREGVSRKEWSRIEVALRRGEANKLFALQLGPLWTGSEKLPPHTRALFAVFIARINADTEKALNLLRQFSESIANGNLDTTGVDELIAKHENTKEVKIITNQHAYMFTVMASLLEKSREDGVQATADFLWLKPIDRKLWYILNTVGRQTPFPEVAGIFAHWIAEKEAVRKLLVPMVEEATNALELALKEVIYKPDDVVEEKNNA